MMDTEILTINFNLPIHLFKRTDNKRREESASKQYLQGTSYYYNLKQTKEKEEEGRGNSASILQCRIKIIISLPIYG